MPNPPCARNGDSESRGTSGRGFRVPGVSEADDLSHAMLLLQGTMGELLGETERLVGAAERGELDERGEPARFQGAFAAHEARSSQTWSRRV